MTQKQKLYPSVLIQALSHEKARLQQIEKELATMPDGNLNISFRNGSPYYTLRRGDYRKGINHDMDLIYRLARKRYLKVQKGLVTADLESVKNNRVKASTAKMSSLLDLFKSAGLDLSRITLTSEQYKWSKKNYLRNTAFPEKLQYTTISGIKVRSKSERIIADRLTVFGIPFRYEPALEVDVSSLHGIQGARRGQYKTYYPDFLIMLPSGRLIIWEHFGLIDLVDYRESAFEKTFVYRQLGVVSESDMILSYECDISDTDIIDEIIVRRILMNF